MAQSAEFRELEEQILDYFDSQQYREVLALAPKLLEAEPWRGEGHYYAAEAYIWMKDYDKGLEYLNLAEKQADPELRRSIELLREGIPQRKVQDQKLASAEKLLREGKKKEAAAGYMEAWEAYKYSGATAQMAVELFLELKDYEQAMLILNDPVFEGDPATQAYLEMIAQTPEYKAISAYNDAIYTAEWNADFGSFEDALANLDAALRYKPNDPVALFMKAEILDHQAWGKAQNANTAKAYKTYLRGKNNLIYREEAEERLEAAKEALKLSRPDKAYVSYVYDTIAPIGFSFGGINTRSLGIYMAGNLNNQLLEGGVETSEEAGEEVPGYGDVVLGLTKKLAHPLWIYAGAGAAFSEYYVTEVSEVAAIGDAGLILNLGGFLLRGGVKTDLEEYRWSAGLGFTF